MGLTRPLPRFLLASKLALLRTWHTLRPRLPYLTCIAISWLLYSYHQGAWSLFLLLPALYLLFRRRWIAVACFALSNPLAVALFTACSDYAHGTSRYVYQNSEYAWTPQGSIDPVTRIRGHNPGCGTRPDNAWVTALAGGLAIDIMHPLIGPPRGAYTGPYPTLEESVAALQSSGSPLNPDDLFEGHIKVSGIKLEVDPYWFHCHYQLRTPTSTHPALNIAPTAVLYQNRCLIIRVVWDTDPTPLSEIYLIDVRAPALFAMYETELPAPAAPNPWGLAR
jgi:hypothetical protein